MLPSSGETVIAQFCELWKVEILKASLYSHLRQPRGVVLRALEGGTA